MRLRARCVAALMLGVAATQAADGAGGAPAPFWQQHPGVMPVGGAAATSIAHSAAPTVDRSDDEGLYCGTGPALGGLPLGMHGALGPWWGGGPELGGLLLEMPAHLALREGPVPLPAPLDWAAHGMRMGPPSDETADGAWPGLVVAPGLRPIAAAPALEEQADRIDATPATDRPDGMQDDDVGALVLAYERRRQLQPDARSGLVIDRLEIPPASAPEPDVRAMPERELLDD